MAMLNPPMLAREPVGREEPLCLKTSIPLYET
jgi:hypothetical protein